MEMLNNGVVDKTLTHVAQKNWKRCKLFESIGFPLLQKVIVWTLLKWKTENYST